MTLDISADRYFVFRYMWMIFFTKKMIKYAGTSKKEMKDFKMRVAN